MINKFKTILNKFAKNNIFADYTSFLIFSASIGILVGFSVVFFHNLVEFLNIFLQNLDSNFDSSISRFIVVLIPVFGMFIQAIIIRYFPEIAKSRGVTEIIKSSIGIKPKIPFKNTLINFFASAISLGTGSTLGPEAPAAFLGGGISNKFANIFNLSEERKRIITASGAGAAISAIFNTPLAGVFFAVEIILLNDFHTTIFSSLIISSISASIVSRTFLGEDPIFSITIQNSIDFGYIYIFAIFGLLSGIISFFFHKYSAFIKGIIESIYRKRVSVITVMSVIGIIIGICGLFYSDIFGIGYLSINKVFNSQIGIITVIILFFLKFLLVPIVYNSGAFGGLFAPSLFLGAMFGYIIHFILNNYFGINIDLVSIILVGMGAYLAGIHSIPITAILMIFELTRDYSFILPLMMSVIISSLVMHIIFKKSIYLSQIDSEFDYSTYNPISKALNNILVRDLSLKNCTIVRENETLESLMKKFIENKTSYLYLIDSNNKIIGIIYENEVKSLLFELNNLNNVLVAKDLSNPLKIFVLESDKLVSAFNLMNKFGMNELLVVDSKNQYPLGIISYSDIQKQLSIEYFKNDLTRNLSSEFSKIKSHSKVNVFDDYFISEVKIPESFIRKSLAQIGFREKFHLEVILIKKDIIENDNIINTKIQESDPNYVFKENDSIVVFGKKKFIDLLECYNND